MREIKAYEQVKIRYCNIQHYGGWGAWQNTEDNFKTACEKAKTESLSLNDIKIQIAIFYYDYDGNFLAWNSGKAYLDGYETY